MKFYRYADEQNSAGVQVTVEEYELIRETRKGYWIVSKYVAAYSKDVQNKYKRWVSKTTRKRYAYPSRLEAINNYIRRKERQIVLCNASIKRAKDALLKANVLRGQLDEG